VTDSLAIIPHNTLSAVGLVANNYAAQNTFTDYQQRTATNTLKRQAADLRLFARYLSAVGVSVSDLFTSPAIWYGMTWGVVSGFVQWQLQQGYAVGSVNVRLATVKRYCELASLSGVISAADYALIKTVKGYGHSHGVKVDDKRRSADNLTRIDRAGAKKQTAVTLTIEQADRLKHKSADTPQARRDALLMCLLLDHGLRCGEVAGLLVTAFDVPAGVFVFQRPKVDKTQTHRMTIDTARAAAAYMAFDAPPSGHLLLGSRKNGALSGGMSERAINDRVGILGRAVGVVGLSPHDCRHFWATRAARMGTDPFALQDAGGWNSLAMPRRYIDSAKVANEGVKL